jgi:hypothetical protein
VVSTVSGVSGQDREL